MITEELFGEHLQTAVRIATETMQTDQFSDERLEKAQDLVLAGGVTINADGSAIVENGNYTYDIDPERGCICEYSQTQSRYCKHYLAVEILKRAQSGNGTYTNGVNGKAPVMPSSATWHVNEAPASCCIKFTVNGTEVMYTMRDVSDSKLFPRVKRVLKRLQENGVGEQLAEQPQPDWCPIHKVTMKRYTKGDKSWYSHKLPDGSWCSGK